MFDVCGKTAAWLAEAQQEKEARLIGFQLAPLDMAQTYSEITYQIVDIC
jgi:hypothetical protein